MRACAALWLQSNGWHVAELDVCVCVCACVLKMQQRILPLLL